jgi:undecaprenyl-diphosphatase
MDEMAWLDTYLFRAVNTGLTSPLLDSVMPYITEKFNFLGAIIVAAALTLVLGKRRDRMGLLLIVAVVAVSDVSSNALKGAIMRVRPCNALEGVRLLVGCGGSFSMPSGHAANIFAAMVFLSTRYRRFLPVFMAIALAVAYSRVYVGVHYPLDVSAGALLGAAIAFVFSVAEKRGERERLLKMLADRLKRRGGSVES